MHRVHLQEWNVQNVPVLKSRLNSTSFPDTQVVHLHQQQPGCPSASCAWHEINKRCGPVCCFVHFAAFYCNVNVAAVYTGVQLAEMRVLLTWWCLCRFCSSKSGGQPCLFAGNIHQCWHWLVSQVLVDVPVSNIWFSKTWLSKIWLFFFFPRLGCPSFGCFSSFPRLGCSSFGSLFFSKTWSSKFWFVVFAKTWLSKFWFLLFFPRLGCPSFGSCCFLRLGCPSFGLSKRLFIFCFLCIPRLGCPSFGKLDHVFFPGLGFHVLAHVSSSHCVFKDVCRKMPTYAFAGWSCGKSSFTCCYIRVDEGLERKHLEDSRTLVSRLFLSLMLKLSSYSQMFCVPFLPAWPNNTQENMSRTIWSWFGPWRHKKQLLESCLTDDIPKRTYGNNNNNVHCSRCCSVNRHGAQGHWLHFIVCTFVDHGFGNDFFCPSCISSSGEEDKLSQETRSLAFTCRRRNQCHQCAISNYAT